MHNLLVICLPYRQGWSCRKACEAHSQPSHEDLTNLFRSVTNCRKIMAKAAKEKGNLCNKDGDHEGALERYTLALTLDPDDFCALSNRARIHLEVRVSQKPLVRLLSCNLDSCTSTQLCLIDSCEADCSADASQVAHHLTCHAWLASSRDDALCNSSLQTAAVRQ